MKQNKFNNILFFLGALTYGVYFGVLRPLELKLPVYVRVFFLSFMLVYCFLLLKELIKQRREYQLKWANANEVEKEELRKKQKFGWLLVGIFLFLGAFLLGITALVG